MLDETQLQALWGDLFEVAVKRGCLAVLQDRGLLQGLQGSAEHLWPWRSLRVADLHDHLLELTGAVDPRERAGLKSSLDHLLVTGWGLGWTVLRECLRRLGSGKPRLDAVFCPLALPNRQRPSEAKPHERAAALWQALGLAGRPDPASAALGEPANADLL